LPEIEPHIQRSIEVEAEATFGCIQLQRRNTKVEKNTINRMKMVSSADCLKVNKVVIDQSNCRAIVAKSILTYSDRFRVSVNAQELS
jgi:hypothetical protein